MKHGRSLVIATAFLAPWLVASCAQTPRPQPAPPLAPGLAGAPESDGPEEHGAADSPSVLFSYPVVDGVLYSAFGAPRGNGRRTHTGTDISAPRGTPVHAAGAGRVVFAGYGYQGSAAWGQAVLIDHGQGWITLYAHLSVVGVEVGQTLTGGEQIGRVGRTGNATGPHLHLEVRHHGDSLDPESHIPGLGAGS